MRPLAVVAAFVLLAASPAHGYKIGTNQATSVEYSVGVNNTDKTHQITSYRWVSSGDGFRVRTVAYTVFDCGEYEKGAALHLDYIKLWNGRGTVWWQRRDVIVQGGTSTGCSRQWTVDTRVPKRCAWMEAKFDAYLDNWPDAHNLHVIGRICRP